MSLPFSKNHISYAAQDRIQKTLSPLTKISNIHYFNYTVSYPNKTTFTLHTNANYFESWFTQNQSLWEYKLNSGWYLWNAINDKPRLEIAHSFDIGNGIIFINHCADKIEVFSFATRPDNHNIGNFYINNLNLLKRFSAYFLEKSKDLIVQANDQLITLPPELIHNSLSEPNKEMMHHQTSYPDEFAIYPFNQLSKREYECFTLLARGYNLDNISKILQIAVPTAAVYIARVKKKLQCNTKDEIIKLAEKHNLIKYYIV